MGEKIIIGVVSAIASSVLTYAFKAASIEGRLDNVERSLIRIELFLRPTK